MKRILGWFFYSYSPCSRTDLFWRRDVVVPVARWTVRVFSLGSILDFFKWRRWVGPLTSAQLPVTADPVPQRSLRPLCSAAALWAVRS